MSGKQEFNRLYQEALDRGENYMNSGDIESLQTVSVPAEASKTWPVTPKSIIKIVGNLRYSTDASKLIACGSEYDWDVYFSANFLFRTKNGRFFIQRKSRFDGDTPEDIEPLAQAGAMSYWQGLQVKIVPFVKAFPEIQIEDA